MCFPTFYLPKLLFFVSTSLHSVISLLKIAPDLQIALFSYQLLSKNLKKEKQKKKNMFTVV